MRVPLFIALAISTVVSADGRTPNPERSAEPAFEVVDVSAIPATAVSSGDPDLEFVNGIYVFAEEPYSGIIEESYDDGSVKSRGSFFQGMRHGVTNTFYPDGSARDSRSYRENLAYGRHVGYWESGVMKFDFVYLNDKREGLQRQWYRSGAPYTALSFRDDKEAGMQQAWRETGKAYINYEARDGFRYGLQKAALCFTLTEGVFK